MTPRQFYLLLDRHKAALAHAELCSGFTTAAVYNTSPFPPKEPYSAIDFMPNHTEYAATSPPKTEQQLVVEDGFNSAVLAAGLRMKAEHDAI